MRTIERVIRRAWWRLVATDVLRTSAIALTAAAAGLFAWRMLSSVAPAPAGWGVMLGGGACAAIVVAVVWSVLRIKRGDSVARRVDERAGLRESLSTALAVASLDDAWSRAAVSQAERTAAGVDLGRALPIESPRAWPAPVMAWGVLALAFALPAPDLTGLFGERIETVGEREVIEARAEVDDATTKLKEQAERLGLKLDFDEETPGEEVGAPEQQTPEEIRAAAVKKLTKLGDELAEKMDSKEQQAREALENRLQRLRQPGPGPAEDLARSLARGEFGKAKQALDELQKQLREGDMSEAQRDALQKQLENLSQQLGELAERRGEMEQALKQAGMSSEEAKKLAADPEALKQALENAQNLTEAQKQQLRQMAEAAQQCEGACENMSSSMSQMAQAMQSMSQSGQMGQMGQAMSELGDQLSQMEMLSSDMASMQAMMQQMQGQAFALGQSGGMQGMQGQMPGQGMGQGQWSMGDTSRQGEGSGGAGRGNGDSPEGRETSYSTSAAKSAVKTTDGPIIGSSMVYESQVRGESRAAFAAAAESASASASDAIESMRVPRAYERAVLRYFGALEREAVGDAAAEESTEGE